MRNDKVGEGRKIVGICLGFAAVMVAAFLAADGVGTLALWLPITAVAGVVAGLLCFPLREWYLGLLGGVVTAPSAFLLSWWWVSWRSHVYRIEFMLVVCIGAIPGVLLVSLVRRARLSMKPSSRSKIGGK